MGLYRIKHKTSADGPNFEEIFNSDEFDTTHKNEWEDSSRLKEPAWDERYTYEANLIHNVVKDNPHIKNVLEIGSGPGILSQKILGLKSDLNYHLVDKPFAKKYFKDNNFKGKFFVKDLSNSFDTDGLLPQYDLVIANAGNAKGGIVEVLIRQM